MFAESSSVENAVKEEQVLIYYDRLESYHLSRQETMSAYSKAVAVGTEMRNIRPGKGEKKKSIALVPD